MFRKFRKPVEMLYTGLCDIYEYRSLKKGAITKQEEVKVYEAVPCRLSYENDSKTADSAGGDSLNQVIKLFISPDIEIKAGSKIVATQNNRTVAYKNSGTAMVYQTHQEIVLELWEEWA